MCEMGENEGEMGEVGEIGCVEFGRLSLKVGCGCDMSTAVSEERVNELEAQLKEAVQLRKVYWEEIRTERTARDKALEELREERFENMTSKNRIIELKAEVVQVKKVIEVLEMEKTQLRAEVAQLKTRYDPIICYFQMRWP
jgi:hypothetical protein